MNDKKIFAKNEKHLMTVIQTTRINSQVIGMKFCIEKCAMLIMENVKKKEATQEIELPTKESI